MKSCTFFLANKKKRKKNKKKSDKLIIGKIKRCCWKCRTEEYRGSDSFHVSCLKTDVDTKKNNYLTMNMSTETRKFHYGKASKVPYPCSLSA